MVDDLHAQKKRIRTLSDSSRSGESSSHSYESESSRQDGTAASQSPLPQIRSRKQNIRELREEFDDYPELYGIRRSARSRKEPSRFKPLEQGSIDSRFRRKKRAVSTSSSDSDQPTDSDEEWDQNVNSKYRTVRTRGNRVNYTSAFADDSLGESEDDRSELSNSTISKPSVHRNMHLQSSQQTCLQKPRGPLIRKAYSSILASRESKPLVKSVDDNCDSVGFSEHASDDEDGEAAQESEWVEDEADVIEEVLAHAVRRKGATGNSTTLYNSRLEKDLNEGFDPTKEEGELQFLIKWRNWSHIHSTWETEASLHSPDRAAPVAGLKKFYSYQSILKEKTERLRFAERDDLETVAYEEERDEQLLQDKMNVERIVAHSRDPETNTYDYLIKWHRLDYRFCSWESGKVIRALYETAVEQYEARCLSTKLPNRKCEVLHSRPKFSPLLDQPNYMGKEAGYILRDYQLEGINWLIRAWTRGNSVILADEMGLGKTIQTIGFLSYLFHEYKLYGPFLIVVPLSTISSWQKELQLWAPDLNTIIYTGDHVSRQLIREHEWSSGSGGSNRRQQSLKFNVCVTTYEILLKDKSWLGQVSWAFLGVDEAHRLKNDSSQLYKALKAFETNTRLLITGTPLQNTMKELWALLHFIMPDIFQDWEEFEETYSVTANDSTDKMNGEAFHNLHKVLKPFLLRRVKKDVESSLPEKIEQILRVDMTKEQANIYRLILARNYDGLMKVTRGHKASFINIVMELKKCCNHAHLIARPSDTDLQFMSKEESLRSFIRGSGKATLLDKLLQRLKSKGHRVLIFSQMVRMLDLIADYLILRSWGFQRLDGSIRGELRKQALDHFNAEGSTDFCFLLSTRAGGLGINLATADTVIIFDSDWNPQNDLQAQARAHRIGQTKQVSVYRLVTRDSVEEKIIESATRKMVLDHLVIQRMDSAGGRGRRNDTAKGQLLTEILRYGAEGLFKQVDEDVAELEVDIDDILNQAETRDTEATAEANPANALLSSFKVVNLDALEEDMDNKNIKDMQNNSNAGTEKSWDQIIPSELRGQLQAEEARKNLVGLELGPRRRRQVKAFQAGLDFNPSSDDASEVEEEAKTPLTQLTEKEIRALVRAIRHFARPLERLDAIAADAELPDRSETEIREVVDAVLKGCRAAMETATATPNEDSQKPSGKGPVFQYGRVSVAARPLLQSLECLEILHQCLPSNSKEARMSYELPFSPKLVAWSCHWDNSDDVRLLAGVYEHGYDNWDAIKLDADLGLGSKLLPVSQTERPQTNHLRSRVDYLLKMLAKHYNNDDANSQSAGKKRKRGDNDNIKSQKSKHRNNSQKVSNKGISKSTSSSVTALNSKPKSAEFVETDDSSSESEDAETTDNPISNKRLKKIDNKNKKQDLKVKSEKRGENSNVPDPSNPINSCESSNLFTKEEEDAFHKMQGPLFLKCKRKFLPIKKHFKQLEHLEDTKDEDPKQFAKVILRIGDHIHAVVHEFGDRNRRQAWKNYLWEFVHIFSKKSTDELRQIYRHTVKKRLKDSKDAEKHDSSRSSFSLSSPKGHGTFENRRERPHDMAHHSFTRDYHNELSYNESSDTLRKYGHHQGRSRDRNERYEHNFSQHRYAGGFNNDRSIGHKEFTRDRNDMRFNNAFNRPPGHCGSTQNIKHYGKDRSYMSQVYTNSAPVPNHFHLAGYSALYSEAQVTSPPKQDTQNHSLPSVFSPLESVVSTSHLTSGGSASTEVSPFHGQHNPVSLSRDPRLTSVRR